MDSEIEMPTTGIRTLGDLNKVEIGLGRIYEIVCQMIANTSDQLDDRGKMLMFTNGIRKLPLYQQGASQYHTLLMNIDLTNQPDHLQQRVYAAKTKAIECWNFVTERWTRCLNWFYALPLPQQELIQAQLGVEVARTAE